MKRVAKFEKVSFEIFKESMFKQPWFVSYKNALTGVLSDESMNEIMEPFLKQWYDNIKLPNRATKGSAGYDFYAPTNFTIPDDGTSVIIPTGIRCNMEEGYVLSIYPRSGMGFKYRVSLDNTVGIIDQDYYYADNEGHIMIKLHSGVNEKIDIKEGTAFAQGLLSEFCITIDDDADGIRTGGFGSTSK